VADSEQKPIPQNHKPLSSMDPNELAAAFERDEGVPPSTKTDAAPAPAVAKTDAASPPAETKPQDDEPRLLKLAKDRDAQRKAAEQKELEQAKPYMDALKSLSPVEAASLARAKQMGDPVAALNALGFTHAQYTARLLGASPDEGQPQAKQEQPQQNPEVMTLKQRLEALERERESERIQVNRQQALTQMQHLLKNHPKFHHINGLGDYTGVERVILQYINENGRPPGDTFEESVRLAAELYEYDLKQQAAKWSKVLTPAQASAQTQQQKAPESPSAGTVTPRTLTNAISTDPGAPRTVPKTRQELIAAFIEKGEEALG